uniref:Uncharacterized protein n=1 Tax=Neogobius melanostomus TaxID=47308 RepID=A0A8C6WVL6_9GOBI
LDTDYLLHGDNSKASILFLSAFFIVQLALPSVATGKTIIVYMGKVRESSSKTPRYLYV